MQYNDSETRFEEGQAVSKRMPLGNTCRWLLVLCVLLSLTGLAAWTMMDYRKYPFIPGVKTINEEPHKNLIAAKAGGLGSPDTYKGILGSPKEQEDALSANGNVRVQRSEPITRNVTCASKKTRKNRNSISVRTSMREVEHEIYPATPASYDPHFRMLFTYTPSQSFIEDMSRRPDGFQIVVLLNMLETFPALVFEVHNCLLPQNVWLVKNPITNGAQVDLSNGKRLSEFYCDDLFVRDGNARKVRIKVDVDLDVNNEWIILKVCFGNSRKCSVVYDREIYLEKRFNPKDVETVIMADTHVKNLMKRDIAKVKTWCELWPQR